MNKFELSILYDYWDDLPAVMELEGEAVEKLGKKPIRNQILQAFSQGYQAMDTTQKLRRRHAMTVNELIELIEEKNKEKVKKSTIYYHLQILMDYEVIQELTSVKKGNITTSYFGRTSKLLLLRPVHSDKNHAAIDHLEEQPDFEKFLLRMNSKSGNVIEGHKIKAKLEKIVKLKKSQDDIGQEYVEWVKQNNEVFQGLDVNLLELYTLFEELKKYPKEILEFFSNLRTIMGIE